MSKSIARVEAAASAAGLAITVKQTPDSTRTAEDAAAAIGCDVGQIVKSLIFVGETSGQLKLFLVSGASQLDLAKAAAAAGEPVGRADPRHVRDATGFAIGGVAPIGHLSAPDAWMDADLMRFDVVWAAAGAPNAVFAASPEPLRAAAKAKTAALAAQSSHQSNICKI